MVWKEVESIGGNLKLPHIPATWQLDLTQSINLFVIPILIILLLLINLKLAKRCKGMILNFLPIFLLVEIMEVTDRNVQEVVVVNFDVVDIDH